MTPQDTLPTTPGWWFWRETPEHEWELFLVRLDEHGGGYCLSHGSEKPTWFNWFRPIGQWLPVLTPEAQGELVGVVYSMLSTSAWISELLERGEEVDNVAHEQLNTHIPRARAILAKIEKP